MQRIPHDQNGVWIQQFKYMNSNPLAKRYYLDNASFLVYSVLLEAPTESQEVIITYSTLDVGNEIEIKFGQFVTPQRNLQLFRKFYFDFDISLNKKGRFHSFPEEEEFAARPNLLIDGESVLDLCSRLGFSRPGTDFYIELPRNFYKLYLGYSHIRNFSTDIDPISRYEAIVSDVLATVGDDCFTWIEIIDNELDPNNIPDNFDKSSALLLDYKLVIDRASLEGWLKETFQPTDLRYLMETIGTSGLELNFVFYPPVASGMQLEDVPRILTPNGILKNRLIEEVSFSVSKSFVESSQKIFEIYFTDVDTNELIFKASSLENYKDFTLIGKNINIVPDYLQIENSVFENLSGITYPTDQFKVVYTIPNDLRRYLSSHLNYKITVRLTDLTSERTLNNVSEPTIQQPLS